MTTRRLPIVFLATVCLAFFISCTLSPSVNREKFDGAYRAAKRVEVATQVGTSLNEFGGFVHNLAFEVSMLKDGVKSDSAEEKQLVAGYADVLQIYEDSLTLLQAKVTWNEFLSRSGVESGGQIPITRLFTEMPDLNAIVRKYNLHTEPSHNNPSEPTVPEQSFQTLWTEAGNRLAKMNTRLSK